MPNKDYTAVSTARGDEIYVCNFNPSINFSDEESMIAWLGSTASAKYRSAHVASIATPEIDENAPEPVESGQQAPE